MARSQRQPTFTQEVSLTDLLSEFASDDRCRAYLETLRWPDGARCPRCESEKVQQDQGTAAVRLPGVDTSSASPLAPSLPDSHLPLWKWFLAVYLIGESKKGVRANQLKRMLSVSLQDGVVSGRVVFAPRCMTSSRCRLGLATWRLTRPTSAASMRGQRGGRALNSNKTAVLGAVERGGRGAASRLRTESTRPGHARLPARRRGRTTPRRSTPDSTGGLPGHRRREHAPRDRQPLPQGMGPGRRSHEHH